MASPGLLLMNEVVAGLMAVSVDKVFDVLSELNRRGASVLPAR